VGAQKQQYVYVAITHHFRQRAASGFGLPLFARATDVVLQGK
jgi:hypothetical protein